MINQNFDRCTISLERNQIIHVRNKVKNYVGRWDEWNWSFHEANIQPSSAHKHGNELQ
jgi:hypothetical protein